MAFAYVILALILLVVLHEAGHFLAARAVGVRATKFYLFFPPAIWKRQVGDVEYGVGAIPAGGFVKLPGMFEPVPSEVADRITWEWEHVQSLVTDGDQRLRMDAARRAVAQVDDVEGLVEPLAEIRDALDSRMAADGIAATDRRVLAKSRERIQGLLDDLHPKAYWRASLWRRMTVIFAGPFTNLVIAFVVLSGFYWFSAPQYGLDSVRVEVAKGSPAAQAGLTEDSEVTGWNGPLTGLSIEEFGDRIEAGRGKPVDIVWTDEDGGRVERTVVPRVEKPGDDPTVGVLFVESRSVPTGHETTGPVTGMREAISEMRRITVANVTHLPKVFFDKEVRDEVGSVVGIVQVADEVDAAGQIVGYIAIISLILAVMNLLPLLPLDGGHLLFGVLEALRRGRPMPRVAFERYSLVGLALVLILFMIGLDNDITRARG